MLRVVVVRLSGSGGGGPTLRCAACRALSSSVAAGPASEPSEPLRRRVLEAAVSLVPEHGWTRRCVEAGARSLELPDAAADMAAPRGGGDLVLHFVDDCNDRLELRLRSLTTTMTTPTSSPSASAMSTELVHRACRERLEMLRPLLPYWPAGLAVLTASPALATDGVARMQRLADDICHYAGDRSTDTSWYARRLSVAGIYASAEAFMLQDSSEGLAATWTFLERRVQRDLRAALAAPVLARAACAAAVNILGLNRRL